MVSSKETVPTRTILARFARDMVAGGIGVSAGAVIMFVAGLTLSPAAAAASVPVALLVWRYTRGPVLAMLEGLVAPEVK